MLFYFDIYFRLKNNFVFYVMFYIQCIFFFNNTKPVYYLLYICARVYFGYAISVRGTCWF